MKRAAAATATATAATRIVHSQRAQTPSLVRSCTCSHTRHITTKAEHSKNIGLIFSIILFYQTQKAIYEEKGRIILASQWRISKAARSSRSLIRISLSTSAILSRKSWAKEHMGLFGEFLFIFNPLLVLQEIMPARSNCTLQFFSTPHTCIVSFD